MPVSDDRLLAWLRLSRVPNIGPILLKRALATFKTPETLLAAHPAALSAIDNFGTTRAQAFQNAMPLDEAQRTLDTARAHGFEILCPDDPRWPTGLKHIPDPPIILFLRGQLLPQDNLALGIVGARECTIYGREQSARFGALLAGAGLTVISGGARGIDTAAHEGALRAKGRTIVVLGCGLLNCYPPENAGLYDRIAAEGSAILSELPLDAPPAKENFPPRNRIITGMSLGILVVEANLKSGSLITARLAVNDYNREVFALPGRIDSPASAGTHHLIKTGAAHLVENVDDILSALGDLTQPLREAAVETAPPTPDPAPLFAAQPPAAAKPAPAKPAPEATFTSVQHKILSALDGHELLLDDLLERTGLSPSVLMAEITMLQIRGAITRNPGNHFAKK